jgi:ApbE superfamily uncharacterized protein (UPF0280 family)
MIKFGKIVAGEADGIHVIEVFESNPDGSFTLICYAVKDGDEEIVILPSLDMAMEEYSAQLEHAGHRLH